MKGPTVPAFAIDLWGMRLYAEGVARSLNVAYWRHADGGAAYHVIVAHREFAALADLMGYDITPKAVPGDPTQSLRNEAAL